jgi:RHS repeat-associated protein
MDVETHFDRLGRRIGLRDPDAGLHRYTYTAFGELATEIIDHPGAAPEVSTWTYDKLGRARLLVNRDGKTAWQWDTAPNGIGLPASSSSPTNVEVRWSYDSFARLAETTWIFGSSAVSLSRVLGPTGKIDTLTYPATPGRPAPFAVDFRYGTFGSLAAIGDHADPSKSYYLPLESDAGGNPTDPSGLFPHEQFGNGLVTRRTEDPGHPGFLHDTRTFDQANNVVQGMRLHFDLNGNVDRRDEQKSGTAEEFAYDSLDRIIQWAWTGAGRMRHVSFTYDDDGNRLTKQTQEDPAGNQVLSYDRVHGGPHAVTQLNGQSYAYDELGNQTTGGGRTVTWTAFGLPSVVATPATTTAFRYDADGQRVEKRSPQADSLTLGGLYERRTSAGVTEHVFTIPGPRGPIGQVTWGGNGQEQVLYLHTDHLRSLVGTSDQAGVFTALAYDPYGRRVQPTQLDQPPTSAINTRIGLNGHEHDDDLKLINMTGREYDPALGRFLTPDPMAPQSNWGQSLNPYSFVENNPVSIADPTGYESDRPGGSLGTSPFGSDLSFSSAGAPGPTKPIAVSLNLAAVRSQLQAVSPCSGAAAPAGLQCAFNVTLLNGQMIDIYQRAGANSRGNNAKLNMLGRGIARILPNLTMNDDTKRSFEGALLLSSVVPVGAIAEGAARMSSRYLRSVLEAVGVVEPAESAAHHIVAVTAEAAAPARQRLAELGMDLNAEENLVYLPANKAAVNPTGAAVHSAEHTKEMYDIVNQFIVPVQTRAQAQEALMWLREALLGGGFR